MDSLVREKEHRRGEGGSGKLVATGAARPRRTLDFEGGGSMRASPIEIALPSSILAGSAVDAFSSRRTTTGMALLPLVVAVVGVFLAATPALVLMLDGPLIFLLRLACSCCPCSC